MVKRIFMLLLMCLCAVTAFCDKTANSLETRLQVAKGEEKFNLLLALAKHHSQSNIQKSLDYAKQANEFAVKSENTEWIANSLNAIAIVNYNLGNSYEALKYFKEFTGQVTTMLVDDPGSESLNIKLITGYNNIGNIYKATGNYDQAMQSFFTGFRLMDSLQLYEINPPLYFNLMNNTGLVYFDLGQYEMAADMFEKALSKSREKKLDWQISVVLNNLGLLAIEKQEYDKALSYYTEAVEISHSLNDSIALQGYYNNIGLICEQQKKWQEALKYYSQSLTISRNLGYKWGIANTLGNVANVQIQMKYYGEAEVLLKEALIMAKSTGIKDLVRKIYTYYFDLYNRQNKTAEALQYHLLLTQVKDSIFTDEKSRIIAEMEAKYESEKKDKKIELLNKDNKIRRVNQNLSYGAIFALLTLAVLLTLLFRMRIRTLHRERTIIDLKLEKKAIENQRLEEQVFAEQQINRLQKEKLEQQNRELAANVIHIMNKNNVLKDILGQMEVLRDSPETDKNKCFNKVSNLINSNLNLDGDWEQFKRHFIEVHPSFFDNLQQQYPSLTPHEQRMCAYMRINLNTKELAQMLNVSPDAVVKSRYRLRKKMELEPESDLTEFMCRF